MTTDNHHTESNRGENAQDAHNVQTTGNTKPIDHDRIDEERHDNDDFHTSGNGQEGDRETNDQANAPGTL